MVPSLIAGDLTQSELSHFMKKYSLFNLYYLTTPLVGVVLCQLLKTTLFSFQGNDQGR